MQLYFVFIFYVECSLNFRGHGRNKNVNRPRGFAFGDPHFMVVTEGQDNGQTKALNSLVGYGLNKDGSNGSMKNLKKN